MFSRLSSWVFGPCTIISVVAVVHCLLHQGVVLCKSVPDILCNNHSLENGCRLNPSHVHYHTCMHVALFNGENSSQTTNFGHLEIGRQSREKRSISGISEHPTTGSLCVEDEVAGDIPRMQQQPQHTG